MNGRTRRPRARVTALGVLSVAAAFVVAGATPASAHASLATSIPGDGATLDGAPAEVVLTFTEPVDPKVSSIRVLDTNGRNVAAGKAQIIPGDAKRFRVRLSATGEGVYLISWRVLSTADGHVTGGTLAFGVGVSPEGAARPPGVVQETPGATPLSVSSRVLFYAGVLALLGAAWIGVFALARPVAGGWFLRSGWAAGVLGALGIAESQRREAGVGFGDVVGTSIGDALLWRIGPLLVAGLALLVARGARRRPMLVIAGGAALAVIVAHVALGHAAAGDQRWLRVASQSAHLTAAAVWIGGLAALLIGLRGFDPETRARTVHRFSTAAGVMLGVLVATGTFRAINETGSWKALTGTGYGRVILAKAGLLLVIAVLGAVNRYRHVNRAGESVTGLRRFSGAEIAIAAVVLGLTGVMASIAPARTALRRAAAAEPVSVVTTGSDFGTTVRARLAITPGRPGPNRFDLRLTDYDSGEPIAARRVAITFTYRGRPGLQPTTVPFARRPDGTYGASGGVVGAGGPWKAAVRVERETTSVEIPLYFATTGVFQTNVIPGDPTLHNVILPGTGSVQFYVDPPRAGPAEVHATFFDASGKELTGLRDFALVAVPGRGREPETLGFRLLSVGHIVGDAQLRPGRWRFDVTARTPAGDIVWAYFEEAIR